VTDASKTPDTAADMYRATIAAALRIAADPSERPEMRAAMAGVIANNAALLTNR
jgi:hypothetical protein